MSAWHLLYLTSGQLSTFVRLRGELKPTDEFAADAAGIDAFGAYLAQHQQGRFHLLTNLADEDYAVESIPLLRGGDRRSLIRRKMRQHFPEPALCCVTSLGHESSPRRQEKLLISALTAPEHLAPWLQAIAQTQAALVGIYSTAQLGGKLLKRLGCASGHHLLLCQFGDAIRESYLAGEQTVFSRLVPCTAASPTFLASDFVAEAEKLHQYLINQRWISREESLQILIIAPADAIEDIVQSAGQAGLPNPVVIDIEAAALRLKLGPLSKNDCCAPLFRHFLASDLPREQFASPELRENLRLAQAHRLIWAMSCVLLATGGLSAGQDVRQAWLLGEHSRQLHAAQQDLAQAQREIVNIIPELGISPENLHQLIVRHDDLAQQQGRLAPWFKKLASALDRVGDIELASLDWQIDSTSRQESALLDGFVQGDKAGTPGQAQEALRQFGERLPADPPCSLAIIRPPSPLPTDDADEDDGGLRQHFSLRITCPR